MGVGEVTFEIESAEVCRCKRNCPDDCLFKANGCKDICPSDCQLNTRGD